MLLFFVVLEETKADSKVCKKSAASWILLTCCCTSSSPPCCSCMACVKQGTEKCQLTASQPASVLPALFSMTAACKHCVLVCVLTCESPNQGRCRCMNVKWQKVLCGEEQGFSSLFGSHQHRINLIDSKQLWLLVCCVLQPKAQPTCPARILHHACESSLED